MADYSGRPIGASAGLKPGALTLDAELLRALLIGAAVFASFLFVIVGTGFRMQLYGDGSLFSFAIAAQDAWAVHWHNISGRLTVYLYAHLLPQGLVSLSGDTGLAIRLYGFLFFIAPLLGLIGTYAADRSKNRAIFVGACVSTLVLCPMIFGFPTEMWIAHSLFWPTLAVCHFANGRWSTPLVFASLLALVLTHEGAVIFAGAILFTLALRVKKRVFLRAALSFLVALGVWMIVKAVWQPDAYISRFIHRAAMQVFNPEILTFRLFLLLVISLAGFGALTALLRRFDFQGPLLSAFAITMIALAVYWLHFDNELHGEGRYYLRTIVILATPVFGVLAVIFAFDRLRWISHWLAPLRNLNWDRLAPVFFCALAIIITIHAVETAKFAREWNGYIRAVRTLSMSSHSDSFLGDRRFVSSDRIAARLNRLEWDTTTPYLSVMLSPESAPKRLVVDPQSVFLWLSCQTAADIARNAHKLPVKSRDLIRALSCLRPRV